MRQTSANETIEIMICPKDELGFDHHSIRDHFNALAPVLAAHGFVQTQYLEEIDIVTGRIAQENLQNLTAALDQRGFIVDNEKTLDIS